MLTITGRGRDTDAFIQLESETAGSMPPVDLMLVDENMWAKLAAKASGAMRVKECICPCRTVAFHRHETRGSDNTVTKFRARDGAPRGTFTVGAFPIDIAFDGSKMWIANNGGDSITILRAVDGALLSEFETDPEPTGFAFDGAQTWVTHYGADDVTLHRNRDGVLLQTIDVGEEPYDVLFDGTSIWVSNLGGTVTKITRTP